MIEVYIKRIETVNGVINAVVQRNYEDARNIAKKIDEHLAKIEDSNELNNLATTKPLLGVPFSVKDHIKLKGQKITVGLPCFKDSPPCEEDANLIKTLVNFYKQAKNRV